MVMLMRFARRKSRPTRIRLDSRFIATLKPSKVRVEYWDPSFTGRGSFGLRLSPTGKKTFVLMYREAGRQRRKTLGTYPDLSLVKARTMALEDTAKLTLGQGVAKATDKRTFSDLAEKFILKHPKRVNLRDKTVSEYERILKVYLLPRWGSLELSSITRRDIRELWDEISYERDAPVMANRTVALISTMFNFAIDEEWIGQNPCTRIKPNKERARERFLNHNEIRALWTELDNRPGLPAAAFKLLLLTGQRSGEVKQMKWSQIQEDEDLWVIPAEVTKNKREHRVPLSKSVRAILGQLRAKKIGDSDRIFPYRIWGTLSWMDKMRDSLRHELGFKANWVTHDLRRTFATSLSELKIDEATIGRILNHSGWDKNVTAVYSRYSRLPEMAKALERWGARLNQIVTGEPAKVVKIRQRLF